MHEPVIARAAASDQPQLHALWQTVFGDPPELIQLFYDSFPPEVSAWVVRQDEKILTAAYLIPGNWYLNGSALKPVGYVYAVATRPDARGNGYAGRLMQAMHKEAAERGMLLYTRPAEAALFPWYEKTMAARNTGRMRELIAQRDASLTVPCHVIGTEEYAAKREALLSDRPHIVCSERFLRLQEQYSDGYAATEDGIGCCLLQEKQVLIPEFLGAPEAAERFAQAVMEHLHCSTAVLRLTDPDGPLPSAAYCGNPLPAATHWGLFLE